ncbi:DUF6259 domain-containing protein [Thermogutta sp.]|uniref:DUF6259 domain-containing protein n=1 Tax=Thermogutta sp. TaxID=1962930 RepID=UPI00321FA6B8
MRTVAILLAINFVLLLKPACGQTIQKEGDVWRIESDRYEMEISAHDGSLLAIRQSGSREGIARSGEDGLWRIRWRDNSELMARQTTVQTELVGTSQLQLVFSHPEVKVDVVVAASAEAVDFHATITPKSKEVLDFVLPARLRFEPQAASRLIFPMGGNTAVGIAFLPKFFEAQPLERPAGWERQSVGARAFIHLFGGPLDIRPMDEPAVALRVTEGGKRWLSPEALRLVSERQVIVNRPPQPVSGIEVLVEAVDGRPFYVGKKVGLGSLWLMGGQIGRGDLAVLQTALVRSTLARLSLQGKPIGLINLPNEVAQGGWSATSVDQWREALSTLGNVVELRNARELQRVLREGAVAAVVNPYAERFPVDQKEDFDQAINVLEKYLERGGHWFEVGGYPFHYALIPSRFYRRVFWNYPPAFADFLHLDTSAGSISVYRVQPRDWQAWEGRTHKTAVFIPGGVGCGADEQGGYLERQFGTFVAAQESWEAPVVRLQIGSSPEEVLRQYAALNGLRRRLDEKLPADMLRKFKSAILVRLTASGQRQVEQHKAALRYLPVPSIVHFTEHLPLGFDRSYPVHYPPPAWYGTAEELAQFMREARELGHLVMPYTNPTWFPDQSPIWEREQQAKSALALDLQGQPYRESYGGGHATGYGICLWHPLVQRYNQETVRLFTQQLPVDILFQDQCAARTWRYDTNPASPTPFAYTEGILSMVAEDSQRVPLSTEGGWDLVAEYQVQLCGMSFGIVPTEPRPPWDRLLREIYPPNLWRVYPVAEILVHDKVSMLMHDLGASVNDFEDLAWVLGLGFALQYRVNAVTLTRDEAAREWLKWLAVLQRTIVARYMGEPVTSFTHERDDSPSADRDGGIIRAQYGEVHIVTNLNTHPLREGSLVLAPFGFLAIAPDMIAGSLQQLGERDLGEDAVCFVLASDPARKDLWLFHRPGGIAAIPAAESDVNTIQLQWDDGAVTQAEHRDGAFQFRVPGEAGPNVRKVWHATLR